MNKKKLTVIIVLAVVAIVILGVVAFSHKAKAPEVATALTPTGTALQVVASTSITALASSTGSSSLSIVVSTSTLESYANKSFSFKYPGAWTIAQYSPFFMTNFNGQYQAGVIIPKGGAIISVVTTTVESGFLQSIIDTQLMNAINVTTTTLTVDGITCPAAAYEANYAAEAISKDVNVYCLRGTELWEVYLSYEASDTATAMAAHVADFNGVLGSMKFL